MNEKYLKIIIYTSIFSIAYGGFSYHRYSSRHSIAATASTMQNHKSGSLAQATSTDDYLDKVEAENDIEVGDMQDVPATRSTRPTKSKNVAKHNPSSVSAAVYTSTQPSTGIENSAYSRQMSYRQPTTSYASVTLPRSTTTYASNVDTSSQNTITSRNDTSESTTFIEQSVAESNGSEFLPDGSSQQDLYNSQSKYPRVYTIKNYRTADISCTPGYNDSPSSHAALMRALKGC